MKMILQSAKYIALLFLFLTASWFVQHYIYDLKGNEWMSQDLSWDYGYNLFLSVLLGVAFIFIYQKSPEKLGYSYLGSISVKFILFFIFIYPEIREDGEINAQEFANFFVPFSICLLVELIYLISLLRRLS